MGSQTIKEVTKEQMDNLIEVLRAIGFYRNSKVTGNWEQDRLRYGDCIINFYKTTKPDSYTLSINVIGD